MLTPDKGFKIIDEEISIEELVRLLDANAKAKYKKYEEQIACISKNNEHLSICLELMTRERDQLLKDGINRSLNNVNLTEEARDVVKAAHSPLHCTLTEGGNRLDIAISRLQKKLDSMPVKEKQQSWRYDGSTYVADGEPRKPVQGDVFIASSGEVTLCEHPECIVIDHNNGLRQILKPLNQTGSEK